MLLFANVSIGLMVKLTYIRLINIQSNSPHNILDWCASSPYYSFLGLLYFWRKSIKHKPFFQVFDLTCKHKHSTPWKLNNTYFQFKGMGIFSAAPASCDSRHLSRLTQLLTHIYTNIW